MKHSTNYENALILPSPDCKATTPQATAKPGSVAEMQFQMISSAPYTYTSDDVISAIQAKRRNIPDDALADFRAEYFSKGQACLRASPLVKTLGWAIHHNAESKVALIDPQSGEAAKIADDETVKVIEGMRNKRA